MRVSTTKAHPKGAGRAVVRDYKITGTGVSASGDRRLPDDLDTVTIAAYASDGVDMSTSSRVFVELHLDDNPDAIDTLIERLTALRAHQRRRGDAE